MDIVKCNVCGNEVNIKQIILVHLPGLKSKAVMLTDMISCMKLVSMISNCCDRPDYRYVKTEERELVKKGVIL